MNVIRLIFIVIVFFLSVSSCSILSNAKDTDAVFEFSGDWQGNGIDSKGNAFSFAAKVIFLGENRYRVLILDEIDSTKDPFHIIEGVLDGNKFTSTADDGEYQGGGYLSKDLYEGFYVGPVNGSYKMRPIKK